MSLLWLNIRVLFFVYSITPRKFDVVPASEADEPGTVSSDIGDLTINKRETRTSFTFRKVRRTPCDCGRYCTWGIAKIQNTTAIVGFIN